MDVLVHIPARAGSKGLKDKNLRTVGGISLVGRAVRAGLAFLEDSGLNGLVLVDTDGERIAEEGRRYGASVPFLRPTELAGDGTPTLDTVLHAVDHLRAEGTDIGAVVLLQPTSPLRTVSDVVRCWKVFDPVERPSVVSVCATDHPPELTLRLDAGGAVRWAFGEPREIRRQSAAPSFRPSGAVYIDTVEFLSQERAFIVEGRTTGVELPRERSVDIDTAFDLLIAEMLVSPLQEPRSEAE